MNATTISMKEDFHNDNFSAINFSLIVYLCAMFKRMICLQTHVSIIKTTLPGMFFFVNY